MIHRRLLLAAPAIFATRALAQVPSERTVETRLSLAFRVDDAALRPLLPPGFVPAPATAGPNRGANFRLDLVERLLVATASDNRPAGPGRAFELLAVIPAREASGTGAGAVVAWSVTRPEFVPGPYRNATAGTVQATRKATADGTGALGLNEEWRVAAPDGSRLSLTLVADRATPTRAVFTSTTFSGTVPGLSRLYQTDQGSDVLRAQGQPDRITSLELEATGPRFDLLGPAPLDRLVSVTAIPWLVRTASLP